MTRASISGAPLRVLVLLNAAFLGFDLLGAQETRPRVRDGDSTVAATMDSALRASYAKYRPAAGLLIAGNPLEQPGASGTEVQAFAEDGQVSRIVASTWTPYGKYTVEYYGAHEGPPRFVFESAVYQDDAPSRPVGRNFWGQPSWERRYYLEGGRVVLTETIGDGATRAASAMAHTRRFTALRALVASATAARR